MTMLSAAEWRRLFVTGRRGLRTRPSGAFALAGPDLRHHDQEFFTDTRHWLCCGRAELIPLAVVPEPECRSGLLVHDQSEIRLQGASAVVDRAYSPGEALPLTDAGGDVDLVVLAAGFPLRKIALHGGGTEVLEGSLTLLAPGRGRVARLAVNSNNLAVLPRLRERVPPVQSIHDGAEAAVRAILADDGQAVLRAEPIHRWTCLEGAWQETEYAVEVLLRYRDDARVSGGQLFLAAEQLQEIRGPRGVPGATGRLELAAVQALRRDWDDLRRVAPRVSVNASAALLGLPEGRRALLDLIDSDPDRVVVELSEKMDWLRDRDVLGRLIDLAGRDRVQLAIDDVFGADQCSTWRMRSHLPVKCRWLKIDMGFFRHCCRAENLSTGLSLLGGYLLSVQEEVECIVVEGVETSAHRSFLLNCLDSSGLSQVHVQGWGVTTATLGPVEHERT